MSPFGCRANWTALLFVTMSPLNWGQSTILPIVHVDTDLVLVPAVVTDKDYRPIYNLDPKQFELRVDGQPAALRGVWKETGPVSVVLVVDASKSMRAVLEHSKEAMNGFLKLAQPEDEYALVLCQERASLAIPFTSDLNQVARTFQAITPAGSTPLFDAIDLAVDVSRKSTNPHRAILVISDGADTNSQVKVKALRAKVREASVYVHVLEFWDNRPYDNLDPQPLRELTEVTGGVHFDDVSPKRFVEYFAEMDVHQRYVLAFQPEQVRHDNKQHLLEVRVHGLTASKPKVFWRRDYRDAEGTIQ